MICHKGNSFRSCKALIQGDSCSYPTGSLDGEEGRKALGFKRKEFLRIKLEFRFFFLFKAGEHSCVTGQQKQRSNRLQV